MTLPTPQTPKRTDEGPNHSATQQYLAYANQKASAAKPGSVDAIRRWWATLSSRDKLPLIITALMVLFTLPWLNPPILRPEGSDFASLVAGTVVPFVLIALGLNVVVGMAGLLDLGYVGFWAVGAYTVGVLTSKHASVPWFLAMIAAVFVAMAVGVILGAPTLRLRGDYLAIVTLGFGEIIRISAQNFDWLGASEGISAIKPPPSFGPVIDNETGAKLVDFSVLENRWFCVFGFLLILLVVTVLTLVERSRVGRAWNAIREDEDAAELMGVPTFKFKLWAFAVGAAVGGLSGAFYAGKLGTIYPKDFEIQKSILFLAAVVLGGIGNRWGVMLGAFIVGYLPEWLRFVRPIQLFVVAGIILAVFLITRKWPALAGAAAFLLLGLGIKYVTWVREFMESIDEKRFFIFGLLLMVMMIFRPQGLLPRRVAARKAAKLEVGSALLAVDDAVAESVLS
jgi:branched-chain amino acid transport system permease protein